MRRGRRSAIRMAWRSAWADVRRLERVPLGTSTDELRSNMVIAALVCKGVRDIQDQAPTGPPGLPPWPR